MRGVQESSWVLASQFCQMPSGVCRSAWTSMALPSVHSSATQGGAVVSHKKTGQSVNPLAGFFICSLRYLTDWFEPGSRA
jgi:hypothetical protein